MYTSDMVCKICGASTSKIFSALVLKKYNIDYFICSKCDFIQTEKPFWLKEAYTSPMNISDTGILVRNIRFSKISSLIFILIFNCKKKFLDYAGGYGVFTRLMRDMGFDFYWKDPYTPNLLSRGFEYTKKISIEAITAFEVFEHLENPVKELQKMIKISPNIFFSTELTPIRIPDTSWWYFGFQHGQHTSLYSEKSLRILAQKLNVNFYTNHRGLHLFTSKKLPPFVFEVLVKLMPILYPITLTKMSSKTFRDHQLFMQ